MADKILLRRGVMKDVFMLVAQGVGQLMHLVTDMSVPAHTRNDGHVV